MSWKVVAVNPEPADPLAIENEVLREVGALAPRDGDDESLGRGERRAVPDLEDAHAARHRPGARARSVWPHPPGDGPPGPRFWHDRRRLRSVREARGLSGVRGRAGEPGRR